MQSDHFGMFALLARLCYGFTWELGNSRGGFRAWVSPTGTSLRCIRRHDAATQGGDCVVPFFLKRSSLTNIRRYPNPLSIWLPISQYHHLTMIDVMLHLRNPAGMARAMVGDHFLHPKYNQKVLRFACVCRNRYFSWLPATALSCGFRGWFANSDIPTPTA